jgi:hypothetical protein
MASGRLSRTVATPSGEVSSRTGGWVCGVWPVMSPIIPIVRAWDSTGPTVS